MHQRRDVPKLPELRFDDLGHTVTYWKASQAQLHPTLAQGLPDPLLVVGTAETDPVNTLAGQQFQDNLQQSVFPTAGRYDLVDPIPKFLLPKVCEEKWKK